MQQLNQREKILSTGEFFSMRRVTWMDLASASGREGLDLFTFMAIRCGYIDGKPMTAEDLLRPAHVGLEIANQAGAWFVEDLKCSKIQK